MLYTSLGNAIKNADTPVMDALTKGEYLTVDASGLAVGLPAGLMGNSEVGHFTMGTGRVVYQVSGGTVELARTLWPLFAVRLNCVCHVHKNN